MSDIEARVERLERLCETLRAVVTMLVEHDKEDSARRQREIAERKPDSPESPPSVGHDITLSTRAENVLLNLTREKELPWPLPLTILAQKITAQDILRAPNAGRKTVEEISAAMITAGYQLHRS